MNQPPTPTAHTDAPAAAATATATAEHSRFVQRVRRRYAPELAAFAQDQPGMPGWHAITDLVRTGSP